MLNTLMPFDQIDLTPRQFPVALAPIDGVPEARYKKVIRTDMDAPDNFMGMAGSRYKPISHEEAFTHAIDNLKKQNLSFEGAQGRLDVSGNGALAKIEVEFPAHRRTIGDQPIHVKYVARNSLNGVWRYQSFFGWLNQICFNTLVSGEKLAYFSNRHTNRFDIDAANDSIRTAAKLITEPNSETLRCYRAWWHSPITDDEARDVLKSSIAKSNATPDQVMDGVSGQNTKQLTLLMDKFRHEATHIRGRGDYGRNHAQGTLWDLFQAGTSWSTHLEDVLKIKNQPVVQQKREEAVRKMVSMKKWKKLENQEALAA